MEAGDDPSTRGPSQLLHVALLDPAYSVDSGLGEIMLGQVVNPFLDEEHISPGGGDPVDHAL